MIYFDNASTSFPKAPGVGSAMAELVTNAGFNINRGIYEGACSVADMVLETRELLAKFLDGPSPRNVILTSGITCSINHILKGFLRRGDHVITTSMEHNAVMRPLNQLLKQGVEFDAAVADKDGTLSVERIKALKKENTKLLIMTHASNVCGTVMPVEEAGAWAKENGIRFVLDAAQTAGVLPISMSEPLFLCNPFIYDSALATFQTIRDFKDCRFVSINQGAHHTNYITAACQAYDFNPNIAKSVGNILEAIDYIGTTDYVTVLDRNMFPVVTSNLKIIPLEWREGMLRMNAVLLWKKDTQNPSLHRFTELAKSILGTEISFV